MPPNNHAVLSASSSHRWLHCTPSARLELEFDSSTSQAAAEGSAAHALAEHKLKRALKLRSQRPTSPFEDDAMDEYTTDYVSFVMEQFYEMKDGAEEDPLVLIEQRLDFSSYVPDGFGTGDAVLLAPGKLHVIDLKYGQGVLVEAEHNSQMMLYALAALKKYSRKYKVKRVSMSIRSVTSLYSGTLTTGSTTFNYGNYNFYIIIGQPASSSARCCFVIPKAQITTSAVTYQFADETSYYTFKLSYSGSTVTLAYNSRSSSGQILKVYGVN